MTGLRLDVIWAALPPLDELRPIRDFLLQASDPDLSQRWSGSGELGTVGERFVRTDDLVRSSEEMAAVEAGHLRTIYRVVGTALVSLGAGEHVDAGIGFLEAARLEEQRERPDRAVAYASGAHRILSATSDKVLLALSLRRWARAQWAQGHLVDAARRYAEAHAQSVAARDPRGAAEAAIGAGNVLEEQGRWREAEEWYRMALDTLGDSNEPGPERWQALLNLHIVTRSAGQLDESLPWLKRAERAADELEDESASPYLLNAWGQLHMGAGRFEEAERKLRDALDRAGVSRATTTIRLNLAESLLAQGRTLDATEEAREAEREAVRSGSVRKLPEVYRILGRIAAEESNPDAFVLFERALELVREHELPPLEEALTLQAYAESEAKMGEDDVAAELLDRAKSRFAELGITGLRHPWMEFFE